MLTSGLLFFFLAIGAVAFGLSGYAATQLVQIAAFAAAALFVVLFVAALVRRSNRRSWR